MATKQLPGIQSKDGSYYITPTTGNGVLISIPTSSTASTKNIGIFAKDGSIFGTITDGNNNLQ